MLVHQAGIHLVRIVGNGQQTGDGVRQASQIVGGVGDFIILRPELDKRDVELGVQLGLRFGAQQGGGDELLSLQPERAKQQREATKEQETILHTKTVI